MLALGELCGRRREDRDTGYFTIKELTRVMQELCQIDATARASLPGLSRSRADIIIPGGAIAQTLMELFGIERIELTRNGLKQGMQYDYMMSRGYTTFDTRDAAVEALALRCRYDRGHAETVKKYCGWIFDGLGAVGIHDLDENARNLLTNSAILHDIGEIVSYENHNVISQALIEGSNLAGFTSRELRSMGIMVRLHHGKYFGPKDAAFDGMDPKEIETVRKCGLVLRMADVLDRHRTDSISGIRITTDGTWVEMELVSEDVPTMEMWKLEKLRGEFVRVFEHPLSIRHSSL